MISFRYVEPVWDWNSRILARGQEERFATEDDLWDDSPDRCPEFVTCLVAEIAQLDRVFSNQAEGVTR